MYHLTCDMCKQPCPAPCVPGQFEFATFSASWGYGSPWDGEQWQYHLCPACAGKVIARVDPDRWKDDPTACPNYDPYYGECRPKGVCKCGEASPTPIQDNIEANGDKYKGAEVIRVPKLAGPCPEEES